MGKQADWRSVALIERLGLVEAMTQQIVALNHEVGGTVSTGGRVHPPSACVVFATPRKEVTNPIVPGVEETARIADEHAFRICLDRLRPAAEEVAEIAGLLAFDGIRLGGIAADRPVQ